MSRNRHRRISVKTIFILFLMYFIVAVPFKVMELIPGFTDIRPVTLLGPVYAIFYGIPGCIVMAVGNLIMDIVSGGLKWSSIAGFIANFAGPFVIYYYWARISKESFSLRTPKALIKHAVIIVISAVAEMIIITPFVRIIYPDVDAALFAVSVVLNTSGFPIIFGIPMLIVMTEELGFKPMENSLRTLSSK